jgi:flagellar hook assembly protein FlgD
LHVYPNPVTSAATIQFDLQKNAMVFLEIYTMDGKLVQTLSQGQMKAGSHEFIWEPEGCSGNYLARLSVTSDNQHRDSTVKIRVK